MPEEVIAVTGEVAVAILAWDKAQLALAEAKKNEEATYVRVMAEADKFVGKESGFTGVVLTGGGGVKAGRYFQMRGGGVDDSALAKRLKESLTVEAYQKYVTEEVVTTTVVKINEAALKADASLHPELAAMIAECETPPTAVQTRYTPRPATAEDVFKAQLQLKARAGLDGSGVEEGTDDGREE